MKINFSTAKSAPQIKKYAQIVLKNRLFTPGGFFKEWVSDYLYGVMDEEGEYYKSEEIDIRAIVLAKQGSQYVAAGLTLSNNKNLNSGVYVLRKWRRHGIGSNIFRRLLNLNKCCVFGSGIVGSEQFFTEMRLKHKFEQAW